MQKPSDFLSIQYGHDHRHGHEHPGHRNWYGHQHGLGHMNIWMTTDMDADLVTNTETHTDTDMVTLTHEERTLSG